MRNDFSAPLLILAALSSCVSGQSRLHHGLSGQAASVNEISIGFLPDFSIQSPMTINKAMGKAMAIVGDYVTVVPGQVSFSQFQWHAPDLLPLASTSVYAPAILPNFALSNWTEAQSTALASAAASLNSQGITVWLRAFYEMNGYWNVYGLQPEPFITAFRSVAQAVRSNKGCTKTWMLWSPNIAGGPVNGTLGYEPYWPGADVVDIAGLSYYWAGTDQTQNTMPTNDSFSDDFQSFYDLYGSMVPLVVSETSAQYHYQVPSGFGPFTPDVDLDLDASLPNISTLAPVPSNSPSELSMKQMWLTSLTSPATAARFPNLTAVSCFNYFKTSGTNQTQLLDYRYVGGDPAVEDWIRSYAGNETAYANGYSGDASRTRTFTSQWGIVVLALLLSCIAL